MSSSSSSSKSALFKDRVVAFKRIPASQLRQNPKNWRLHPEGQRSALASLLDEIGFAGALLVYQDDDQLTIIDGHLRADVADDTPLPVLITDLTEEEADKLLATYDPLSAMAEADREQLEKLMDEISFDNEGMNELMEDLRLDLLQHDPGSTPTLDEVQNEYGTGNEDDFWPVLKLKLSPEVHEIYQSLIATVPGESESEQFGNLLARCS